MKTIPNKIRFFFVLLTGMTLFLTNPAQAQKPQPQDAILAVVNNDIITYRDLGEYLKARLVQLRAEGKSEEDIKKIISDLETNGIKRLIEDKLLTAEAKKKDIQVRKELVDERVKAIQAKYPSEEVFLQALNQDGMTVSDIRTRIENQLKVQQLVEKEIKSKIHVNPQEITDFYTQNLSQFQRPERINLDSIFVSTKADDAKAKEKIQKALDAVKAGKDFRQVAQEYSEAPALGTVPKGQMLPQIEDAVWKLNIRQISEIIPVENGLYLFKVIGKVPVYTATLEEVKDSVQENIFQEKFHQKLQEWLEQLKKNAFIEIKE